MKKTFFLHLTAMLLFVFLSQFLFAQATRTWVSGVGDDVNPCSRTAPCKTFAGAISKTAIAGEINIIDPAGYGAVTITKSITIDGNGSFGSILASATNGVIINAPDGIVTLRHLFINGTGTTLGLNGVRIISAKKVIIEDCFISNFSQRGIEVNTPDSCAVILNNVTVHNVQDGISISTSSGSVIINHCNFQDISNAGINLSKWQATVSNSNVSACGVGVVVQANTTINLSNNVISHNNIALQGPGKINSAGNNMVTGNRTQGVVATIIKLQ
jgi:Right handed beta helix region